MGLFKPILVGVAPTLDESETIRSHKHYWTALTNPPDTATRWPTWDEVTSKPALEAAFGNPPVDGYVLSSTAAGVRSWVPMAAGVTDHGALSGLGDDDHPHYLNQTRGDARYSQLGHTHSYLPLTGGTLTGNLTVQGTHNVASNLNIGYATAGEKDLIFENNIKRMDLLMTSDGGDVGWYDRTNTTWRWRINSATGELEVGQVPWARLTGVPSTFTPSSHSHSATEITSGTLSDARLPTTQGGKTFTGYTEVQNVLTSEYYLQTAHGNARNNLGSPSVTEMALFEGQFDNKLWFYPHGNLTFERTDNGTDWIVENISQNQKEKFVAGGGITAGIVIPRTAQKYRITIRNKNSYVYLNALYMYWSSSGNTANFTIWKKRDDGNWEQHTFDSAYLSSWPGHLYIPFGTIPWSLGATSSHRSEVRIEITPNWTHASNAITLYALQLWGGYPAGRRTIYSHDEYQNVAFPAELTAVGAVKGSNLTDYDLTLSQVADWNALGVAGGLRTLGTSVNGPAGSTTYIGLKVNLGSTNTYCLDIAGRNDRYFMRTLDNGTRQSWRELFHTGHFPDWSEVAGKPSTFTPSAHGHAWSDLSGIPSFASRWPTWSEVTSKPSTFTPSAHTHAGHDVTVLGNRLTVDSDGKIRANNTAYRRAGLYGIYDSYKTGHIWSMGSAYQIPENGADFGNLYGLAYKHTNNATGGNMAGGHQMVWCVNGVPKAAMGDGGIWTSGTVYEAGGALNTRYAALSHTHSYLPLSGGTVTGTITGNNTVIQSMSNYRCYASHGNGFSFWNSDSYKIYMSSRTSEPYGCTELDAVADYNMYFRMSGANRGFVFWNGTNSATAAAQITGAGDIYARNNINAGANVTAYSDARLKENIETIPNALYKVDRMRGVFFNRKGQTERRVGVIAQEVQKVLPEVVMENGEYLSVDYGNIVGLLIEAVKELSAKVEKLERRPH